MKTKRPASSAKAEAMPLGAVPAVGTATARGTSKGAMGRFTEGEKLRADEGILAAALAWARACDQQQEPVPPKKAVPPRKAPSRARQMADVYQRLDDDPSFGLKSREAKHAAVLDAIGVWPAERRNTGWSEKGLFNELSRRRRKN